VEACLGGGHLGPPSARTSRWRLAHKGSSYVDLRTFASLIIVVKVHLNDATAVAGRISQFVTRIVITETFILIVIHRIQLVVAEGGKPVPLRVPSLGLGNGSSNDVE